MRLSNYFLCFLLGSLVVLGTSCEKDETPTDNGDSSTSNSVLRIENGAQAIALDGSLTYSAVLVDENGDSRPASGVSWSSSDGDVATINNNGALSVVGVGTTTIQASINVNGGTLSASVPLSIALPAPFVVGPAAILVDTDFPDLQIETVYLGLGTPSYSYSSSDNSIATVSSSGLVTFVAAGECVITVTATGLDGSPSVQIPVMVMGRVQVPLPVTRVEITPGVVNTFKNENISFSAQAFNGNGDVVITDISWTVADPNIATIDANGNVTTNALGETQVIAVADGISAQAQLVVHPDQVVILTPYYTTVAPGATQNFNAELYEVNRSDFSLSSLGAAPSLQWEVPTFGFPMFDIATIDQSGTLTMKNDAIPGLTTLVLASVPNNPEIEPGAATVMVATGSGGPGGCQCGSALSNAASIQLNSSASVTLSAFGMAQIDAEVLDANGNVLSNAQLVYCSSDVQVADVDFSGQITGGFVMPGANNTATITICHGNLSVDVNVTVQ